MKTFITAFSKRSWPMALSILILPLLLTLWTAPFLTAAETETAIPLLWQDMSEDDDELALLLQERIQKNELIDVSMLAQDDAMEDLLAAQTGDAGIILPKDLSHRIYTGDTDGILTLVETPATFADGILREVIGGELARLIFSHQTANQVVELLSDQVTDEARLWQAAYDDVEDQWEPGPLMTIDFQTVYGEDASATEISLFTPYKGFWTLFTWMISTASLAWVLSERTLLQRMNTTMKGAAYYLRQKGSFWMLLHLGNAVIGGLLIYFQQESISLLWTIVSCLIYVTSLFLFVILLGLCCSFKGSYWLASFGTAIGFIWASGVLLPSSSPEYIQAFAGIFNKELLPIAVWIVVIVGLSTAIHWKARRLT
ncbi:hypothetical protein G4V62_07470 [Bacillaceae bacterium SIJ1]|uniref:hypothetical protein n=1 Tax=Litoribacterium kuwaitense TaxID=1398745 RepID=UPI0013EDF39E|nr:hypothetical protein [Litoribacterium kuwaitense]NGP44804.1 hypothetical protein [Litoribacterium kuwaitense]